MKCLLWISDGNNTIENVTSGQNMSPDLNGCDTGAVFVMEDEDHQSALLNSLNMMRKSRTFCDVILHVS